MNIGIIGCGAIAQFLLKAMKKEKNSSLQVTDILVRETKKYEQIADQYDVTLHTNIDDFLQASIDIVVEAATVEAVQQLLPSILPQKDVILISIGALVDQIFLQEMKQLAKTYGRTIYLPSGAIGGLDLLQHAHALQGVEEVILTTRKPAYTLTTEKLTEAKVIFKGTAEEAIKQFPQNINVAIVLSLATIGMKQTKVRIVADPFLDKNEHHIQANGEFGDMTLIVKNEPLPSNPKTSYLAALSVFSTLKNLKQTIKIG